MPKLTFQTTSPAEVKADVVALPMFEGPEAGPGVKEAGKALGRSDRQIQRQLADFKQVLGSPWRGDEKAAALAAWITLASERRTRA